MKVLITRPHLDAQETADLLHAKIIQSIIDPMSIVHLKSCDTDISTFNDIIFTSKNGVRGFCQNYHRRDLTAWCVGDETADLAKKSGFKTAHSAQGNSDDLLTLITSQIKPQQMLRIYGDYETDHLGEHLVDAGYTLQSLILYEIEKTTCLSSCTIGALRSGALTDVLLYSPNTAQIFNDNIKQANMHDTCRHITVWCISKKTAGVLSDLDFKEIVVAQHPTQNALLDIFMQRNGLDG